MRCLVGNFRIMGMGMNTLRQFNKACKGKEEKELRLKKKFANYVQCSNFRQLLAGYNKMIDQHKQSLVKEKTTQGIKY